MTNRVSRLAPSPTGALHLGNARTFVINWALARRGGWRLLMRVDDLDGPRVKPQATQQALEILAWLGLDHDGPILRQSDDLAPYRRAMRVLTDRGRVYACALTRKQIEQAASAPHADEHELRFPPELRPAEDERRGFGQEDTNYRFLAPDEAIRIDDDFAGPSIHRPQKEVGDFVVWTRRGVPAYQLAVVVDDARQGVTDVVRGDDLLPSAARQMMLYEALDLRPPRFCHLPLVVGTDGRRLAKRHGDTRLATYQRSGVRPERIVGLLAAWSGIIDEPAEMTAADFRDRFLLDRLPPTPVTFTEEDHEWLLAGC
ncbi:MAG: tRNA glutamyl-Q(34) synthetase GluQRS [Planctomycetota bacterium]|nr:tRNA glutamyl-Q(34) synthetase GluQRS [Planctomycetota bacterium]